METVTLEVPKLYADHHVLSIREALADVAGIQDLYVSSAWKQVMVTFDPSKVDQPAIEGRLAEAGYPVGEGEVQLLLDRDRIGRDPQWAESEIRTSQTNPADLEMVSQFHRR